jgi:hypothetical protein
MLNAVGWIPEQRRRKAYLMPYILDYWSVHLI